MGQFAKIFSYYIINDSILVKFAIFSSDKVISLLLCNLPNFSPTKLLLFNVYSYCFVLDLSRWFDTWFTRKVF